MRRNVFMLSALTLVVLMVNSVLATFDVGKWIIAAFSLLGLLGAVGTGVLWLRYIQVIALETGPSASGDHPRGWWRASGLERLRQQMLESQAKFSVTAKMIANLIHGDDRSGEQLPPDDPIAVALQQVRVEMRKMKEEEEKGKWISQGLARFSEILRDKTELSAYANHIIANLVRYVQANQGGLYIEYVNEEGERYLELTACYAYGKRKFLDARIPEGQGLLGQCMLEKDVIYLTDIPKGYITITSGLGEAVPRNVVVMPLLYNDQFYGAVELASFDLIQPHQMEFLRKVCENIASEVSAMKNMKHTEDLLNASKMLTAELQHREEEMKQNMEELSATQEEMARKQTELTGIINAIDTTLGTLELDTHGKLVKHNAILEKIFHMGSSQLTKFDYRLIVGEEAGVSFDDILEGRVRGGDFSTRGLDEHRLWVSATFTVVHDVNGQPKKILCLLQDITDKKNKEQEFERLSLVTNNTDNAVIITDADGITEFVNDGFTKMTGYRPEDIVGHKPGSLLQGEETDTATIARIREKITRREPIYEEIQNYDKHGRSYWVSLAINPVFSKHGTLEKFISIQADITETKRASLDFRYKLEAISRSNLMIEWDTAGNLVDANGSFLALTGFTIEALRGRSGRDLVKFPESGGADFHSVWSNLLKGDFVSGEVAWEGKDGRTLWLDCKFNPILDMGGKLTRILTFATDLTEAKYLQQVADRKQRELDSYLSGINNTIASAEFDVDGNLRNANDIFLKVMGYKEETLGTLNIRSLMGDDQSTTIMWDTLRDGKFFSGEFRMKDSIGKELWLVGTFNPIVIEGDVPDKIMMFAQFTTQEKEKVHDLNEMVRALKSTLPVLELTDAFTCKTANEMFLKLFHVSRLELRSKTMIDFIEPGYHGMWNHQKDKLLAKDFAELRLPVMRNGLVVTYEASLSVTRNLDGGIARVILLLVKEIEERVNVLTAI